MVLGVQRRDETGAAVIYRSSDLVSWELEGELGFPQADGAFDSFGYMWECPGLVRVLDETTGEPWDVLIWCPQGISPQREGFENIFPCVYTVGHLVGTELRDCRGEFHEVDRGFEFYAPQVFARRPSEPGPVLMSGWAGNASQDDQPSIEPDGGTGGWVHALTVPRVLSLRGGRLIQRPALALPQDAASPALVGQRLEPGEHPVAELAGQRSWHLSLQAEPATRARWGVRIGSPQCHVEITLEDGALRVCRATSRYTRHGARRTVTLPQGCAPRLEILHDRSITEVFVGDGDLAFTLRSFVEVEDPAAAGAVLVVDKQAVRLDDGAVVTHH